VMGVGFVFGGDANEASPWTPENKPTAQVLLVSFSTSRFKGNVI
jgi:hypothetical protein